MPSDEGIILSTGRASDFTNATGSGDANSTDGAGIDTTAGVNGNARLDGIAGVDTFDGSILEATFIPEGSTLTMQLVFSSEEYPEYANSGFNDAVGIYVNGVRAELAIGTGDISIDNITQGGTNADGDPITPSNENLYVDNTGNDYNTEMDGFTVTLTLKAPVNPGEENTIWIGIADAGDATYDSNLMIAANSVQTEVIAYDDDAEVGRNDTVILDVLGNDTSAEGTTLTITQINGQDVAPGDSVTLLSGSVVTLNPDGTLSYTAADDLGTETISYQIDDGTGTTDVGFANVGVTCFARGTLIRTAAGDYVAIESLRAGDLVATRDNGAQALRWIGSTTLCAADLVAAPQLRPIRIRAGALGQGSPSRDLLVSPQHRILVSSKIAQRMFGATEVLVAAKQLVALDGIEIATDLDGVVYFHLLFDRHEVVVSQGALTESLFTGAQALLSVGPAARQEILTLFPHLADVAPTPARPIVAGKMARRLAERHAAKDRRLLA